ncbi:hypothetical protein EYR38_001359 [Pleurotus pulmonarius]|nr:hypothetical protein EYR38_001359 [Pleurotus pulmonarius]
MLVLHPSSRCDVCLDPYSWDDAAQSPHAIPCGHIFCKTCLGAVVPSSCPLCRKAFAPDRIKKLHVDRPENVDPGQGDETRETELLRSLSLSWGENTPQEDIEALTGEVSTFLENKADDVCIALRKARDGILQYHKLQKKREKDRTTLMTMNRLLKTTIERAEEDSRLSKSIEESLILERDRFKTQVTCSECATVIEKLKADLAKYQYTTNPLPKPPEPVPIDRYPAFARAAAAGLRSVSDPHVPLSPKHQSNGTSAERNANGASTSTRPHEEYVSPDPTVRAEIAARDRESAELQQAEEARRREEVARRKQKQPLYNTHRYPATDTESSGKRSDLIPGASPNQRVIPSSSTALPHGLSGWSQPVASGASSSQGEPSGGADAAAPAGAYVAGYARGYGYGYNYAPSMKTSVTHDGVLAMPYSQPLQHVVLEETPRVGLGLYAPPSPNRHRDPEESLLQPPQTAPASTTTTSSRPHGHHRSSRSRRDNTHVDGHATDSTVTPSSASSGAHRSRRRSTRTGNSQQTPSTDSEAHVATPASHTASDRESISSWGTVPSNQPPGSTGSSVADLGLQWFPPGTGVRTSASSDSSRNPYFPFAQREPRSGPESVSTSSAANTSVEATPRASDRARPNITDPLETLSMLLETNTSLGSRHARVIIEDRPRPSRHSTLPEHSIASARTDSQSQASGSSDEHRSHRRHRPRRGSTTTGILRIVDENAAPPAPALAPAPAPAPAVTSSGVVDEGYLSDAPQQASQSFGNALGLDLTEEPLASNLVISAPTPIVSTRNFLRSWSYDH